MNVCFVEFGYPSLKWGGGAGTYVQIIGKELIKKGHKVFVISQFFENEPEEYNDDGIKIYRLKFPSIHYYFTKIPIFGKIIAPQIKFFEISLAIDKKIREINKNFGLDIIEYTESGNILNIFSKFKPYVVHLHGSSYTFKKYCGEKIDIGDKLLRKIEGMFIKNSDFITSPSEFLRSEVVSEFNIDLNKTQVIPYPICVKDESNSMEESKKKNLAVFYSGRIEKRKGVDVLFKSAEIVLNQYKNVKFNLFGAESKDISVAEIKKWFSEIGILENIEINSFIPREELQRKLYQADICVVPSVWDNSPYAVYEAMAMGKAVVASKTGGISELIDDELNGFLVPPKNPEKLAEILIKLLEDEKLRNKVGKNAQLKVKNEFNIEKIVDRRLKIYQKLL